MARGIAVAGGLLIGFLVVGLGLAADPPKPPDAPAAPPADVDVTTDARDWNDPAKFSPPPTDFREGKVTPRTLDEKAIAATAAGFTVSLPSKAPIPTPTVYRGAVYVSGGFHSKEFYAFDAATGAVKWAITIDDDGPSAAVCDDGVTVFNTESCTIFAVDADTGKPLWSKWLGDPLTSTPAVADGVVYTSYPAGGGVPGANNNVPVKGLPAAKAAPCSHVLAALDLKTGKILWQRWVDSDIMSAPVVVGGEVYGASFAGVVYRFAAKDGAVLSAVRTRATSAPVVVGKDVYLTRRADNGKDAPTEAVNTLGREKLDPKAAGEAKAAAYLDPKVQDRAEFKAANAKLDAANGFSGGAPTAANPGAAKDNVGQSNVSSMQAFQGSRVLHVAGRNVNSMGDHVVCSDPATGKELWTHKVAGDLAKEGGFLAAPPAAAGGHLFVTTLKGDVLEMDPADGKVLKTWAAGSPVRFQPAVEGGRIYVGTQDGKLVCLDTKNAALTGWPCWGGNAAHTGAVGK